MHKVLSPFNVVKGDTDPFPDLELKGFLAAVWESFQRLWAPVTVTPLKAGRRVGLQWQLHFLTPPSPTTSSCV